MQWKDHKKIAHALQSKYGDVDPLSLRFTDLHDMVVRLKDFQDSPQACSEGLLEKIQMDWYDLHKKC